MTYRASNDHGRLSEVVSEVERNFHAGVSTTNDKHFFPGEFFTGLVITSVNHLAGKLRKSFNLRHHSLRILSCSHHKPPANILDLGPSRLKVGHGLDSPQPAGLIEPSGLHTLVELWVNLEPGGVRLEVIDELTLRRVLREVLREGHFG